MFYRTRIIPVMLVKFNVPIVVKTYFRNKKLTYSFYFRIDFISYSLLEDTEEFYLKIHVVKSSNLIQDLEVK